MLVLSLEGAGHKSVVRGRSTMGGNRKTVVGECIERDGRNGTVGGRMELKERTAKARECEREREREHR